MPWCALACCKQTLHLQSFWQRSWTMHSLVCFGMLQANTAPAKLVAAIMDYAFFGLLWHAASKHCTCKACGSDHGLCILCDTLAGCKQRPHLHMLGSSSPQYAAACQRRQLGPLGTSTQPRAACENQSSVHAKAMSNAFGATIKSGIKVALKAHSHTGICVKPSVSI